MTTPTQSMPPSITAYMLNNRFEAACSNQHYWVTGECKNAVNQPRDDWTFDMVCREGNLEFGERLSIIRCRIWSEKAYRINIELQRAGTTLAEALLDGMSLEVYGETKIWSGSLQLLITSIRP